MALKLVVNTVAYSIQPRGGDSAVANVAPPTNIHVGFMGENNRFDPIS